MKLDKRSSVPLYAQLKELLRERIENGDYEPGEKIPTELALCDELELSRPTVRQAIADLVAEGLLYIVKGRGTFVAAEPEPFTFANYQAFSFSFLAKNEQEGIRLIDYRQVTKLSQDLLAIFGKSNPDYARGFYEVAWLEEQGGEAYAYCESVIPAAYFPHLIEDLKERKSMAEIMQNKLAYAPFRAEARLYLRPSRSEEARYLDLAKAYPVFIHQAKLYHRGGGLCEVVKVALPSDKCAFALNSRLK